MWIDHKRTVLPTVWADAAGAVIETAESGRDPRHDHPASPAPTTALIVSNPKVSRIGSTSASKPVRSAPDRKAASGDHPSRGVDARLQVVGCQHLPDGDAGRDHDDVSQLEEEEGQQRPVIRGRDRQERDRGRADGQEGRGQGADRQMLDQHGDGDRGEQAAEFPGAVQQPEPHVHPGQVKGAVGVDHEQPERAAPAQAHAEDRERQRPDHRLMPEEPQALGDIRADPQPVPLGLRPREGPPDRQQQQRGDEVGRRVEPEGVRRRHDGQQGGPDRRRAQQRDLTR